MAQVAHKHLKQQACSSSAPVACSLPSPLSGDSHQRPVEVWAVSHAALFFRAALGVGAELRGTSDAIFFMILFFL
jgi:hypothetical protein